MSRTATFLICLCLIGSRLLASGELTDFEKKQKQLLKETDHQKIYQDCKTLMQSATEAEFTGKTYIYSDPNYLIKLPESIRKLEPICVYVTMLLVEIGFTNQSITYYSDEFGFPEQIYAPDRGYGYTANSGIEPLAGNELLEHLNETFEHFEMEIAPRIVYENRTHIEPCSSKWIFEMIDQSSKELNARLFQLMHKTNHEQLLRACRELIYKHNQGIISDSVLMQHDLFFSDNYSKEEKERIKKELKHIPKIILDLNPISLSLHPKEDDPLNFAPEDLKEFVEITFIGGFHHAGVLAYLDDDIKTEEGSMMLLKGLFYYDDNLRDSGPEYKQYLRSLKQEPLTYREWARKNMQRKDPNNISP